LVLWTFPARFSSFRLKRLAAKTADASTFSLNFRRILPVYLFRKENLAMNDKPLLALILLAAFQSVACGNITEAMNAERIRGSGKIVSEPRNVRGFSEVSLRGSGELTISQGNTESLTVEADDNILPKIDTVVEGDKLSIGVERGVSISPSRTIRYTLTVRDLSNVELSGSGTIRAGAVRSDDFQIKLSGSGEIRIDGLSASSVRSQISGSGDIELRGKVFQQEVRISGSGDYIASELQSDSTSVATSGSGDARVWAEKELSVRISGSGDVDYQGDPSVSKHVSGSGNVRSTAHRP
jgi:hypothetical protein